jgi:type IV pilus assembly protein PilQ
VVQSGTRSRLILELDRPVRLETALEGKALLITLRRPDTSAARDATGRFQDPVAGVPGSGIRDVEFQPGESGEGRIVVEVSDAAVPIEVRRQGARLVVDFLDAQVPRELARRLDVQDFGTPVRTIDTYPLGGHARISVELAAGGELSVYQFDRRLVLAPLH